MKKILLIALFSLAVMTTGASGQEAASKDGTDELTAEEPSLEEAQTYPSLKPEGWILGGYRFTSLTGSGVASPYEYLRDSWAVEGGLRVYTYPQRLALDLDVENEHDYFADVTYAYKDLVLFRGIDRTVFHNLSNVRLGFGDNTPSPPVFGYGEYFFARDTPDTQYGLTTSMNNASLRFKMPDYPFHIYFEGTLVHNGGDQQQNDVIGAAWFNAPLRVSQSRDIDTQLKTLVVGTNSHFGPIEIDYSHGEKIFTVGGDSTLYDSYLPGGDPTARNAGVYPHNEIPELSGSSNTIKLHTNYTGSLVGTATFTEFDNRNRDSGATADYFVGGGEVTWMPTPILTCFLRYRHKEADINNPSSVTITDITNAANSYTYQVKPSISSITDTLSGTVRYRLLPKVTLKADYSLEHVRRENAQDWNIPGTTERQVVSLSSDARITKDLTLSTRYTHKEVTNPSTNIEPNRLDEGRISVSWLPLPQINTLVSYIVDKEKRNSQTFVESDDVTIQQGDSRDVDREKILGTITFVVLKDLSVSTSIWYMRNKINQDITYEDLATFSPQLDSFVPYGDSAHAYSLGVNYVPMENLTLNASATYTISSGAFYPTSPLLLEPVSVASFSEIDVRETDCTASGEYRFKHGFAVGIRYKYSNIHDELDNPYGNIQDGTAQVIMLTATKRW